MTEKEFCEIRKPFYLDIDTLIVRFPESKYMNENHAKWFSDRGIPFVHTVRGYLLETAESSFIMLYWNDFEIPNINASLFSYLFQYFPNIDWIGLGCIQGKIGEIWKPRFKVKKYE